MSEFIENDAELTLTLEDQIAYQIANNLTTTAEGYALDARQGKVLDDKKLDKTAVANNLTTIDEGRALDARQGKWLNENKVGFSDIANDLVTNDVNKVLSAAQGVALKKLTSDGDKALEERLDATDAAVAENRTAIAGKISMKTATVNLPVSGWVENNQTVSVGGVTVANQVVATPSTSSHDHYSECSVRCTGQSAGALSFACITVPTIDLKVNVMILDNGLFVDSDGNGSIYVPAFSIDENGNASI